VIVLPVRVFTKICICKKVSNNQTRYFAAGKRKLKETAAHIFIGQITKDRIMCWYRKTKGQHPS
jgi:hypothetical protein